MYLKALKLSRLLELSAGKIVDKILLLVLVLMLGTQLIVARLIELPAWTGIIAVMVCVLIGFILYDVCYAKKIFIMDSGRVKIFIYKKFNKQLPKETQYEVVIQKGKQKTILYMAEYNVPFNTKETSYFVFRYARDKNKFWYLLDVKRDTLVYLGLRLNKILFLPNSQSNQLNVLAQNEIKTLNGEYMVYDDICLVKGVAVAFNGVEKITAFPDKILLVKKQGLYQTYGFYFADIPVMKELIISSLIFREGRYRVIIRWNNERECYQELYRCLELVRTLNEFFIEMDEKYDVGGRIYQYDGKNEKLNLIYEGDFLAIDFDKGEVLGSDGKVYGSNA